MATAVKKEKTANYFEAVGRRKTSVARVRLFGKGDPKITVNDKPLNEYFPTKVMQNAVEEPLTKMSLQGRFLITVRVNGGGISSQSEAVRHGIARALTKFDLEYRKKLKKAGLLTRDPRMKERRKFGLKKARKAPQWSKR
jgi:small subunit ribosomal protein S9